MRLRLKKRFIAALAMLLACAAMDAVPAAGRALTVYTPDWPPFYIHESSSADSKGMAWDILRKCARTIDDAPIFDNYPIRRMLKLMEDGQLDVNIMSFKEDRTKFVTYGKEVVFENNYVVWVGSHVTKKIRSLSDLNNLSIAQLVGLRPSDQFKLWFDARLKNQGPKETLVLNEEEQILKMLASGRVDATVGSEAEVRWRSRKLGLSSQIKNTNVLMQKQPYFIVVAKQSPLFKERPSLLPKLDQCIRDLKREGTWATLRKQYDL